MIENKKNVPKLRFPGFTDDWEQRKLGKLAHFAKGQGYSKNDLVDTGTPIILYGRLYTKYQSAISEVDTFAVPISGSCYSTGEEVIVPSSGETAEDIARASAVVTPGILLGGDLNIIYPNKDINIVFLALSISNGNLKKELSKKAQGKSVVHLHNSDLKSITISFPKIDEQAKITELFAHLDLLITQHQRKLEHLKERKKGLLHKMFPKSGEQYPEIRFPGFEDAWQQRRLGELMNVTSVKRIHQSDWTDSGIRFLRARDIVSISKNEKLDDYLYISQEKYDEYSAISGKVKVGDLLITGVGTIGIPLLISDSEPVYFKDGNIIWFQNNAKIEGSFFYYSFLGKTIQCFIRESAGIGTVGTYTIDSGRKTPIMLPAVAEQKVIGSFFNNLDHLISLHQRKLEHLQMKKKALLQQMFI